MDLVSELRKSPKKLSKKATYIYTPNFLTENSTLEKGARIKFLEKISESEGEILIKVKNIDTGDEAIIFKSNLKVS